MMQILRSRKTIVAVGVFGIVALAGWAGNGGLGFARDQIREAEAADGGGTAPGADATPRSDALRLPQQIPVDPDAFVAEDSARILADLQALSHDSLMGRRTGEPGNASARRMILAAFQEAGLKEPPAGWVQPFEFRNRRDTTQLFQGANVVGWIEGTDPEAGAIVLTAHYDHVGHRPPREEPPPGTPVDSIFNGADDNASGVAGILSFARYFVAHPARHTLVLAALDAEELGLRGGRAFVETNWPENIVLNVNLDMISRSDSLLFAVGTYHYPQLKPILESVQARGPVVLAYGHDQRGIEGVQDWTGSSDHAAFHARGIPFVYFGVEDHPDVHRPGDEFEKIDPGFYLNAVRTILAEVLALDARITPSGAETP